MDSLIFIVYRFFSLLLGAVSLLMLIRAILSWIPSIDRSSRIIQFIYVTTEIFISPVRDVMEKIRFVREFPLDLSFLVTYILINFLQGLISIAYALLI